MVKPKMLSSSHCIAPLFHWWLQLGLTLTTPTPGKCKRKLFMVVYLCQLLSNLAKIRIETDFGRARNWSFKFVIDIDFAVLDKREKFQKLFNLIWTLSFSSQWFFSLFNGWKHNYLLNAFGLLPLLKKCQFLIREG